MTPTPRSRATRTGVVTDFDDPRGLGTVLGDDGRRYDFHCTAIADGSRRIDTGVRVAFVVGAGHRGRLEARAIVPGPLVLGPDGVDPGAPGGGDQAGGV